MYPECGQVYEGYIMVRVNISLLAQIIFLYTFSNFLFCYQTNLFGLNTGIFSYLI